MHIWIKAKCLSEEELGAFIREADGLGASCSSWLKDVIEQLKQISSESQKGADLQLHFLLCLFLLIFT